MSEGLVTTVSCTTFVASKLSRYWLAINKRRLDRTKQRSRIVLQEPIRADGVVRWLVMVLIQYTGMLKTC